MPQIIIPLAVIAGLLVAIIGAGFFIKYKLRGVSRSVFGTDDFMEGYREQKRKLSETPVQPRQCQTTSPTSCATT